MSLMTGRELLEDLQRAESAERYQLLTEAGVDASLDQLVDAASSSTWNDAREAVSATELVMQLCDAHGEPRHRTRARWARSRALANAGMLTDALACCEEGIEIAERHVLTIEAARLRLVLMQSLAEMGRLPEAQRAGNVARDALLAMGERALAARAEINLGIVHQRRDDPESAVESFARARPWLKDEPMMLGILENNCGEALLALGDFSRAEAAFEAAAKAFELSHSSLSLAIAEGNLADLAARRGDLQTALLHFERARRQLETDAAAGHLARLRAEQAEAIGQLGLAQDAISEFQQVLPELDRCGFALEAARARAGMGWALMRLGRAAEAETALAAAAKSYDELGHLTQRAKVDLWRAEIALRQGRVSPARTLILHALAVLHERPVESAAARFLLGRAAMNADRLEEADLELAAALAHARSLEAAPMLSDIFVARGMLRRRQGRMADAAADFEEAVSQIERVRRALKAERFRSAYLGDRAEAYHCLVQTLLDSGTSEEVARAFALVEQAKGRSLLELMQASFEPGAGQSPSASDPDEQRLLEELAGARAQLTALYSAVHDTRLKEQAPLAVARWRNTVRHCEQQIDRLQSRLATTQGAGSLYAATIRHEEALQLAAPGSAIIEYFFAGSELIAFVMCDGRLSHVRGLGHRDDAMRAVAKLQFQVNRALRPGAGHGARATRLRADIERELAALDVWLIRPLRSLIGGAKRLTIVPHGPLHLMPFHALFDGTRFLIESHEIHYSPSVSLLAQIQRREHEAERCLDRDSEILIVGVGDEVAPRIEQEAHLVARTLAGRQPRSLIGAAATADRVTAALQKAGLVHLACHGRFSADAPLGSGIRLADRWLTVRDICGLRLHADLVTLSGCETGVNMVSAGDELMGLLRGFFAAGAASTLVSLWRVDDDTTAQLMQGFYERLGGAAAGTGKAAALREAQLQMMAQHRHPAFWAPFVLQGRRD